MHAINFWANNYFNADHIFVKYSLLSAADESVVSAILLRKACSVSGYWWYDIIQRIWWSHATHITFYMLLCILQTNILREFHIVLKLSGFLEAVFLIMQNVMRLACLKVEFPKFEFFYVFLSIVFTEESRYVNFWFGASLSR